MLEDLTYLVRLQHIDNQLKELDAEKEDLPEQISKLENDVAQLTNSIHDANHNLQQIIRQQKEQSNHIEDARERLKKSQSIIYNVKTTREYDAISSEIDQAKNSIAESERRILEMSVKEDNFNIQIKEQKDKLKMLEQELSERKSEMSDRVSVSADEELQLQHERNKLTVRLKKPVLAHYERIRKMRDGVGVSTILDNACSYCFSRIPPQRQAEIRKMSDVILCEVCGCIMVSEEHAEKVLE